MKGHEILKSLILYSATVCTLFTVGESYLNYLTGNNSGHNIITNKLEKVLLISKNEIYNTICLLYMIVYCDVPINKTVDVMNIKYNKNISLKEIKFINFLQKINLDIKKYKI